MIGNKSSSQFSFPTFQFAIAWKRRRLIIRSGIYGALLCFLLLLILPWKSNYEALIRIEPDLSTTGETTSLETEMDVIRSWGALSKAVDEMERTVVVVPQRSSLALHIEYYIDFIANLLIDGTVQSYAEYQPSVRLGVFKITYTGDEEGKENKYVNKGFTIKVIEKGSYILYAPGGKEVLKSNVGALNTINLDKEGLYKLDILVTRINAGKNERFNIIPVEHESFVSDLQKSLDVGRKGFKERAGLMTVDYSNRDPELAQQLLDHVIRTYMSQAFDRSSLGKIKGLEKLESQSAALSEKVAEADRKLAEFKDANQLVDIPQDQSFDYKRSLEINAELVKTTLQYKEASVSLTDEHPSVVALRKKVSFLEGQLNRLNDRLGGMPQKQRELNKLQRDVDVAQTMLDQNTMLKAQLSAQVEMISGYAHLISFHSHDRLSPVVRGILVLLIGFMIGSALALAWLIRKSSPDNATICDAEDLAIVALPVVAKLPFTWNSWKWLWYSGNCKDGVKNESIRISKSIEEIQRLEREIDLLLPNDSNKVLLFTGVDNTKNTSFCARQFAIASAKYNKTLLIDANILSPQVHEEFDRHSDMGLTDVLIDKAKVEKVIQDTGIPDLHLLAAGRQTSNFRLLTGSADKFSSILSKLSTTYKHIIIEFPPLSPGMCDEGILKTANAVFVVADCNIPARKFANILRSCGVDELKSAFYIFNKK